MTSSSEQQAQSPAETSPAVRYRDTHNLPWTEQEELVFEDALRVCGKGRWAAISRIMQSRTPRQVKNHAYTYFQRMLTRRARNAGSRQSSIRLAGSPRPLSPIANSELSGHDDVLHASTPAAGRATSPQVLRESASEVSTPSANTQFSFFPVDVSSWHTSQSQETSMDYSQFSLSGYSPMLKLDIFGLCDELCSSK